MRFVLLFLGTDSLSVEKSLREIVCRIIVDPWTWSPSRRRNFELIHGVYHRQDVLVQRLSLYTASSPAYFKHPISSVVIYFNLVITI